jgi:hypothetical protein
MAQKPTILLVSQPGHLRDSLQVLLTSLSGTPRVVLEIGWSAKMIKAVKSHPVLVFVVMEPDCLEDVISTSVAQIKTHWPQTRLVALVDTEQQCQAATSAGADRVWFKGTLAAQILVEIEALLKR